MAAIAVCAAPAFAQQRASAIQPGFVGVEARAVSAREVAALGWTKPRGAVITSVADALAGRAGRTDGG